MTCYVFFLMDTIKYLKQGVSPQHLYSKLNIQSYTAPVHWNLVEIKKTVFSMVIASMTVIKKLPFLLPD